MDWSRAKNIFIIIFITLNLFLLIYSGIYKIQGSIPKETATSILSILQKKGIRIDENCQIPGYNKKTPMLELGNGNINKEKVVSVLLGKDFASMISFNDNDQDKTSKIDKADEDDIYETGEKTLVFTGSGSFIYRDANPSALGTNDENDDKKSFSIKNDNISEKEKKQIEKDSKELIESLGINASSFFLDRYVKDRNNDYTFIFLVKYSNFIVFDNKISISVNENGISKITCSIREVKGFTKNYSSIIPVHQILLKNFYNKDDMVIKSIDIGFKGFSAENIDYEAKGTVQSPSWRVLTDDDTEMFFKAYDGEEIN